MNLLSVMPNQSSRNAAVLGPEEFAAIADYAKRAFGLHLPPAKREMVFARLIKRLRQVGITNFADYLRFVMDDANIAERSEFLSALTTNVTQFFRENHHFEFLQNVAFPPLLAKARQGHRIRFWSAGCSAGQEPYSLAMTLIKACPEANSLDIKILATDIDPRILETARVGRYTAEECAAIPETLRHSAIKPTTNGLFEVEENLRKLITFAELNLMSEWPMQAAFDVIFCRNVAIYFDAETQSRLWNRFATKLNHGGHLLIGHSERMSGPAAQIMRNVGVTIYTKVTSTSEYK